MAASMILSGVVALFGESKSFMIASLVVLFLGFAISIAVLLRVQKKYNGGVFLISDTTHTEKALRSAFDKTETEKENAL